MSEQENKQMREIKFRAWSKEFGMSPATTLTNMLQVVARRDPHDYPDELMTLMQFTGLKDKNGREVYERDVVRRELRLGQELNEVAWTFGGFYLRNITNDAASISFHLITEVELEVIGNIYENPELLK
jgi:uncharacterized phage protein (TIGR01671 family)